MKYKKLPKFYKTNFDKFEKAMQYLTEPNYIEDQKKDDLIHFIEREHPLSDGVQGLDK